MTVDNEVEHYDVGVVIPQSTILELSDYEDLIRYAAEKKEQYTWEIADLLCSAERVYGEDFAMLFDAVPYEYGTINNWMWIARSIPIQYRVSGASIYMHQVVAPHIRKALENGNVEEARLFQRWLAEVTSEPYKMTRAEFVADLKSAVVPPSMRIAETNLLEQEGEHKPIELIIKPKTFSIAEARLATDKLFRWATANGCPESILTSVQSVFGFDPM